MTKDIKSDLHRMKLHEIINIPRLCITIIRVPGGWIYEDDIGMCFVPFNLEFCLEK